ncbi:MAG: hypothetical protein Q9160_001299 [Pyrenula sp. 1 TL-2023]
MASRSPSVSIITLSDAELASKRIEPSNLQRALESLHKDGICVIKNAVDPSHLDLLNERMTLDAIAINATDKARRNFGLKTGNIQLAMPVNSQLLFGDVLANPFAVAITECVLGPHPVLRFQGANAAFRSQERQPVHVDLDYEYPELPFGLCININLVDVSPENGSTEFWLGSHLAARKLTPQGIVNSNRLKGETQTYSPVQLTLPKGSLIIRDLRIWHAGMPNSIDEVRIMLIGIQFPHWYRSEQKIVLPIGGQDKMDWGNLSPAVEWVEEGADPQYASFSDVAPTEE